MLDRRYDRRRFLQLSAGTAAGAFLAACSGGAASQAPASASPGGAASPGASASASAGASAALTYQGEIELWDWNFEPRQALLKRLIGEWQAEHPGITIKYSFLEYGDAQTKLLTAASAGNAPHFANIHNNWRFDLQRQGVLAPYPDDLLPFDKLLSTPFNKDAGGKVYTSTFNYFCDQAYINHKLLEAEGISLDAIPTTWDDYINMCKQLTKTDANGKITQSGWTLNHYYSREWLWQTLIYQQGGWMFNEDGTEAIWNSPEGVEALKFIQDIYLVHKVDSVEAVELFEAFGTQKAATYISQGYTGAGINTTYPEMVDNWSTRTTPTFTGKPEPAWGVVSPEEGFGVFSQFGADIQAAAFSFIQKILGPDERALEWAKLQGGPPDREDLLEDPSLLENDLGRIIETQAATMPWRVNYGERPLEAEKYWRTMFDRVLLENGDPKAALDEATTGVNAEMKASGKTRIITERNYKPA